MKSLVRAAFDAAGLNFRRYDPLHDLGRLLKLYGVEAVFDVGANMGMSGRYFRNLGFKGPIVSFEPTALNFPRLEQAAAGDPQWSCLKLALGDAEGEAEINVSGGSGGASSFLKATPDLTRHAPELATVHTEKVKLSTVDRVAPDYYPEGDRLFLKLDVEGFEKRVIEGARETLPRVVGMRIELSLIPTYESGLTICDMLPYVYGLGFRLCGIEEAWSDQQTAETFGVDGVFFRTEKAGS